MPHLPETARGPAEPTSIIVADEPAKEASLADFFSFDSPGGFTWWAGAILGTLGCCAFAAMIIIHTKSNAREPPAVMGLMGVQQCPFLSSLLPPLAFSAWHSTCRSVSAGSAYRCATAADCVALGRRCADPKLLARLQCVSTSPAESNTASVKVCAYPSLNSTSTSTSTSTAATMPPTAGFCTKADTRCALCLDGSCGGAALAAGSIGCPSTSACSDSSWLCNPLSAL